MSLSRLGNLEHPLTRLALIVIAGLVAAWVGYASPGYANANGVYFPRTLFVVLGIPILLWVCQLTLRRMTLALTALIVISPLINTTISTSTQSPLNLTIVIVGGLGILWLLRMLLVDKRLTMNATPMNGLLAVFLVVAALAWLASYAMWDWRVIRPANAFTVQAGQYAMFLLSVTAFWLTANHRLSETLLTRWTLLIIGIGFLGIVTEIREMYPRPFPAVAGALLMWPVVLMLAQLLFNPASKVLAWLAGGVGLALWAVWVRLPEIYSFKGGWAPALIAMGLLVVLRWPRLIFVFGLVGALLVVVDPGRVISDLINGEIASGTSYRPIIWSDVWRLTEPSWLLGLGPVNYMYYFPMLGNSSATLQHIFERSPFWAPTSTSIHVPSHNMYVDLLAQTGILGLSIFVAFELVALRFAWRLAHQLRPGFLRAYVYGVLCGCAALFIGSFSFADWLIPFVYNITIAGFRHSVYTWLLLGTLVAIHHQHVRTSSHVIDAGTQHRHRQLQHSSVHRAVSRLGGSEPTQPTV